jgi:signal transduction histidine kinase
MVLQVLWNLVNNATEAITPPGEITITTVLEGTRARVTVTDTGEGIPAEYLARVFTPFYTTRETGTGLGLSICERIVSLHRGTMTIDSKSGRGTTVSFTLAGAEKGAIDREGPHGGAVNTGR